uniref:Putative ovule protein n=1 Tax=Solanum chacoense TaxID=4108 RepID=A0A0V0HYW0_SOLCH
MRRRLSRILIFSNPTSPLGILTCRSACLIATDQILLRHSKFQNMYLIMLSWVTKIIPRTPIPMSSVAYFFLSSHFSVLVMLLL